MLRSVARSLRVYRRSPTVKLLAAALVLILGGQLTSAALASHEHAGMEPTAHGQEDPGAIPSVHEPDSHAILPDHGPVRTSRHDGRQEMPCGDQPLCGWGLMDCAGVVACAPVPVLPSNLLITWDIAAFATVRAGPALSLSDTIPAVQSPPPRA